MPRFDTEVPVLLFRMDRNPFHHGTLGAIRSLGRAGIEVHTFVESRCTPVRRSRYLRGAHGWPRESPWPGGLLTTLRQVSERIGRPAVLVPMDDMSAIGIAGLAEALTDRYLLPAQPPGLPQRVADKARLAGVCRALDVAHPSSVVPDSARAAAAAARELGLPVVAKWSRPWLLPRESGLRSTTVVRTAEEAGRLYERAGQAGSALLLQRYVPGGPGRDWFFHGCFGEGGCLIGGAGVKERSWPVGTGLTAVGRWLPNPQVEAAARDLARRLGFRGILDLDFRLDDSGTYQLLDFNPRPGAQFRLFTDRRGVDVVRALHLDLTGRPVGDARPVPGRVFVAENYALLSAAAAVLRPRGPAVAARPAPGTAGAAPGTAGPAPRAAAPTETAWFAGDDPVPFLAMAAHWLARGGGKGLRRLRRALAHGRELNGAPARERDGATARGRERDRGAPRAPRTPC
ncbi:ATP-grasp domain-containing protein, partial [Streptomyces sp. URMC 123]|uniref:carboxylate--amine ligase n=1 Tax=Streptomyces sp. URMC 123 TaxID=3423403 RepID=UPI003F1D0FC5